MTKSKIHRCKLRDLLSIMFYDLDSENKPVRIPEYDLSICLICDKIKFTYELNLNYLDVYSKLVRIIIDILVPYKNSKMYNFCGLNENCIKNSKCTFDCKFKKFAISIRILKSKFIFNCKNNTSNKYVAIYY